MLTAAGNVSAPASCFPQVCGELAGMVEAVDDLRQFLGPELQAVTGDSGVI
jgi:hypothetical protein